MSFGFQGITNVFISGLTYKGTWDALLNNPTLTSSVGVAGEYYIVSVAGTTNLNGTTDWQVGDWAIFEGSTNMWQKVDNHDVQAYTTIQEEGSNLPQRSILDFQGDGVTATDFGGKTIVTIPTQQAYSTIQDEGTPLTQRTTINFTGQVTASDVGGLTQVNVPTQQAYTTIQEEGVSLTQTNIIDFQGSGVTATNGLGKTIVTIPGTIPATNVGLYAQTALSIPVISSSGEASLIGTGVGTLSVPANAFQVGDSFTAKMCGYLSCANNEDIHIRVRSNGIVIADAGVFRLNITTNKYFELLLDFTITKLGGAGVAELFSNGQFSYNKNANTTIDANNFALISNTTFNTTIINTLTITAQWVTSNPANTIQSQNFVLNKIY